MAVTGLSYVVAAKYSEDGYTDGRELAQAISADISITTYEDMLYANNGIRETEKGFRDGTIALNIDDLSQENYAYVAGSSTEPITVGEDISAEELISSGNDNPPNLGVGFYADKKVGDVPYYRAIWLTKVKFATPNETLTTRGEAVSYGTPTISGTIQLDKQGNWKREATFATPEAAIAWLDAKAGIVKETA